MFSAGVLTISDKGSRGERTDASGEYIIGAFQKWDIPVACYEIIPDDQSTIARTLAAWADAGTVDLILTTGGTGLSPRDVTPEATRSVIQKEVPGIAEIMRISGFKKTPTAVLSRAVAGSRGRCLIINLPGNPRAVQEYLDLLMPIIPHAIDTIQGKIGDHK
jgi:molybdenum cofactor synthesis domain-containing protein